MYKTNTENKSKTNHVHVNLFWFFSFEKSPFPKASDDKILGISKTQTNSLEFYLNSKKSLGFKNIQKIKSDQI